MIETLMQLRDDPIYTLDELDVALDMLNAMLERLDDYPET